MVLRGVLREVGLPAVLAQLADGGSSGCLHVEDPVGEQAKVFLRAGRVHSVTYPGRTPQLGARLVSSGDLAPEALADALQAQRTELQGWRLSELLVHLGYVEPPVVETFVQEQLRSAMADLLLWDEGTWRFRVNERTREDVATPVAVAELLADVDRRRDGWDAIRAQVPDGSCVPVLASAGTSEEELAIDPDAWSLLCKVDGLRTVAELARDGGFTLYEAAGVVAALVTAGLVEVLVPEPAVPAETETEIEPATVADGPPSVSPALLAAFAPATERALDLDLDDVPGRTDLHDGDQPGAPPFDGDPEPADRDPDDHDPDEDDQDEEVERTLHRVSDALSAMLGPGRADEDQFAAFSKPPLPETEPDPEQLRLAEERATRRRRDTARRPGDAAELLAAHAELQAARAGALGLQPPAEPGSGPLPHASSAAAPDAVVVDLAARRGTAQGRSEDQPGELEQTRQRPQTSETLHAPEPTEPVPDEQVDDASAEAVRIETERSEAERVEAQRVEVGQAEAEPVEADVLADDVVPAGVATAGQIPVQARSADEAADLAAAARAELADAVGAPEQVAPDPAETTSGVGRADEPPDDSPVWVEQDTDTASLLRELSSLGFDDDDPEDQGPRPVTRQPVGAYPSKQKKKGLFGRG